MAGGSEAKLPMQSRACGLNSRNARMHWQRPRRNASRNRNSFKGFFDSGNAAT